MPSEWTKAWRAPELTRCVSPRSSSFRCMLACHLQAGSGQKQEALRLTHQVKSWQLRLPQIQLFQVHASLPPAGWLRRPACCRAACKGPLESDNKRRCSGVAHWGCTVLVPLQQSAVQSALVHTGARLGHSRLHRLLPEHAAVSGACFGYAAPLQPSQLRRPCKPARHLCMHCHVSWLSAWFEAISASAGLRSLLLCTSALMRQARHAGPPAQCLHSVCWQYADACLHLPGRYCLQLPRECLSPVPECHLPASGSAPGSGMQGSPLSR